MKRMMLLVAVLALGAMGAETLKPVVEKTWNGAEGVVVRGFSRPIAHSLAVTNATPYTLVVEMRLPAISWNSWRSAFTTSLALDGAAFVNPKNEVGIAGVYRDIGLKPGSVVKFAAAYDGRKHLSLYANGQLIVSGHEVPKAGIAEPIFYLAGDENGEDGEVELLRARVFNRVLSQKEIATLW